jgi:hypothetical protein
MRKATYRIPSKSGGAAAEMSVSSAGGSLDANIERWAGQFRGEGDAKVTPTREERTVGPFALTVVRLEGTYLGGGMPGAAPAEPQNSYALLAAIVPLTDGNMAFFKMTGPGATVRDARNDFERLVQSFHRIR